MGGIWESVTSSAPRPATGVVLAAALFAAVCVLWSPAWQRTRHLVTIAHEGAHALVATAVGRRLTGIRLHSDTSGLTVSRGRPTGPGMVATLAAGYLGPSLLGLGAALVLHTGHAAALLWGVVVLLGLLLLKIRNWYGLWSVLVCGCLVFAVTWWLSLQVQSAFAHALTAFLLLAGPRAVLELHHGRRRGQQRGSDADQLARLTGIPAALWVALFGALTLAAVVGGAMILAS
ncbi:M50 family metallopeptidase [Segeticoccus rhizosphaerae]|uniref:M50 family metallopeptidase n=1 Tax=Segeticoccus rhizosphaerae TaxID=1104777 RepID=UPI001264FC94|nr:M50 family metallopeptidase [Segeticoccus rhizosphaerae]